MATTKCISGNVQKNNAATIAQGGNVGNTAVNNSITLRTLAHKNQQVGSYVYQAVSAASSGNLGTIKPYTAGVFSSFEKGQYIMKIGGNKISQVATTTMKGGANYIKNRPFNKMQVTHTGFLTTFQWNSSRDGQPVYTLTQSAQAPDFGVDKETTTLGQLAYRTGKPLPVQGDYTTPNSN